MMKNSDPILEAHKLILDLRLRPLGRPCLVDAHEFAEVLSGVVLAVTEERKRKYGSIEAAEAALDEALRNKIEVQVAEWRARASCNSFVGHADDAVEQCACELEALLSPDRSAPHGEK